MKIYKDPPWNEPFYPVNLVITELNDLYCEQMCYLKMVYSQNGLFCESLTFLADLSWNCVRIVCVCCFVLYLSYILRFCVWFQKTVCCSRSNFMLTIKRETGWSCISAVSLVNISQLLFTFMPGQIETHQSRKAGMRIWSLIHSINFHILFSTTKEEHAVTFQIKICPFQLTLLLLKNQNVILCEEIK